MMVINNIWIEQRNNFYRLILPSGIVVAEIQMPPNGEYMYDSRALEYITKALAHRWGVSPRKDS